LAAAAPPFPDPRRRRDPGRGDDGIANLLSLADLLLGLAAMALHGFTWPLWQNGALFLGLLLLGTFAFATGNLGGSDVKLLAALGLWFDFRDSVLLVIAVTIPGGLLALVMIIGRRLIARVRKRPAKRGMIPYGIAIVAGAAFVMGGQYRARIALTDPLHNLPSFARP
jgi:prepilin peptidase CpaA